MPRALLAALITVSLLYAAVQAVCVALLPDLATIDRPLVAVGERLLGTPGALLVMAGIAVSVGGNLLGSMFATSRITYRMALDGHLPQWLGTVHPRHRTPTWSIVAYATLGFLLALKGSFAWLAALSVLTRMLLYLCCVAALPRLQARAGAAPGLRLPGGPAIALLAMAVCVGLATQADSRAWLMTLAFLAIGTVLFLLARRLH